MASIVFVLRLVLVVVFAAAATAKLRDRLAFRETVVAFGVPLRVARAVALAIICVELTVAVALMIGPAARWGAAGAAALLVVFTGGITNALRQGLTPDCNCFGQLSSEQIGRRTLTRNVALLALAGFVIWKAPGSSLSAWTSSVAAASVVAALLAVACALLGIFALDYRRAAITAQSDSSTNNPGSGLGLGDLAPAFELTGAEGETVSLATLRQRGLPTVLVFASPTCAPCTALMPELARWSSALEERLTLAVIESGVDDPRILAEFLPEIGDLRVLTEPEHELAESFSVHGTPTAVAIGADGLVVSELALGSVGIEGLIRSVVRDGARSSGEASKSLARSSV